MGLGSDPGSSQLSACPQAALLRAERPGSPDGARVLLRTCGCTTQAFSLEQR